MTYRVDTTAPDMTLALQGSNTFSGWPNGTVELIERTNDKGSGLRTFEANINNAGWVDATTAGDNYLSGFILGLPNPFTDSTRATFRQEDR